MRLYLLAVYLLLASHSSPVPLAALFRDSSAYDFHRTSIARDHFYHSNTYADRSTYSGPNSSLDDSERSTSWQIEMLFKHPFTDIIDDSALFSGYSVENGQLTLQAKAPVAVELAASFLGNNIFVLDQFYTIDKMVFPSAGVFFSEAFVFSVSLAIPSDDLVYLKVAFTHSLDWPHPASTCISNRQLRDHLSGFAPSLSPDPYDPTVINITSLMLYAYGVHFVGVPFSVADFGLYVSLCSGFNVSANLTLPTRGPPDGILLSNEKWHERFPDVANESIRCPFSIETFVTRDVRLVLPSDDIKNGSILDFQAHIEMNSSFAQFLDNLVDPLSHIQTSTCVSASPASLPGVKIIINITVYTIICFAPNSRDCILSSNASILQTFDVSNSNYCVYETSPQLDKTQLTISTYINLFMNKLSGEFSSRTLAPLAAAHPPTFWLSINKTMIIPVPYDGPGINVTAAVTLAIFDYWHPVPTVELLPSGTSLTIPSGFRTVLATPIIGQYDIFSLLSLDDNAVANDSLRSHLSLSTIVGSAPLPRDCPTIILRVPIIPPDSGRLLMTFHMFTGSTIYFSSSQGSSTVSSKPSFHQFVIDSVIYSIEFPSDIRDIFITLDSSINVDRAFIVSMIDVSLNSCTFPVKIIFEADHVVIFGVPSPKAMLLQTGTSFTQFLEGLGFSTGSFLRHSDINVSDILAWNDALQLRISYSSGTPTPRDVPFPRLAWSYDAKMLVPVPVASINGTATSLCDVSSNVLRVENGCIMQLNQSYLSDYTIVNCSIKATSDIDHDSASITRMIATVVSSVGIVVIGIISVLVGISICRKRRLQKELEASHINVNIDTVVMENTPMIDLSNSDSLLIV